jgi:hypothetical protein
MVVVSRGRSQSVLFLNGTNTLCVTKVSSHYSSNHRPRPLPRVPRMDHLASASEEIRLEAPALNRGP